MDVHPSFDLPSELRLRVLSLLPPNELALGGRLACKDAAERFSQPHHRTVHLNQQLPPYFDTCLKAFLRHWPLRHVLWLLVGSPRCGREEGVEAVWRAVQPHLFLELLRIDHYLKLLHQDAASPGQNAAMKDDIGSAAVAGGLAHLLPSLAQRCPGLLDPGRTLEAAARHCDLAGLQAAWELLWGRIEEEEPKLPPELPQGCSYGVAMALGHTRGLWFEKVRGICRRMMAAAAASSTPDATAKMEWVRSQGRSIHGDPRALRYADVWGAAAASGDLSRMQWLSDRGFQAGTDMALWMVLKHADVSFVHRLEIEDGEAGEGRYLPRAGDAAWGSKATLCAAASSPKDSAAKLQWLAGRGAVLGSPPAIVTAAKHGNLEALQLLLRAGRAQPPAGAGPDVGFQAVLGDALAAAVESGSVPTASWLIDAMGCTLQPQHYKAAFQRGDLPMLTWLLQAGCPRVGLTLCDVLRAWPSTCPADSEALVEALRLLAAAGWPALGGDDEHPLMAVACKGHSWALWCAVVKLLPLSDAPPDLLRQALTGAARAGFGAMLEALVGLGGLGLDGRDGGDSAAACYAAAARNGDLGTLECLRRLGAPLAEGAMAAALRVGAPLCALQRLVEQGAVLGMPEAHGVLGDLREGRCYKDSSSGAREEVVAWVQGRVGGEAIGEQQGEHAAAGQRRVGAAGGSGSGFGEHSSDEAGMPGARSTGRVHVAARGLASVLLLLLVAAKRVVVVLLGGLAWRFGRGLRGTA